MKPSNLAGTFAAKGFQGEGFGSLMRQSPARFQKMLTGKPRSRDVYLLVKGFKG